MNCSQFSSDRDSDIQMMGQEYLMKLATGLGSSDEEHVNLSSLDKEVHSEYEE